MIENYYSQNPEYWKKIVNIQNKLFENISGCEYCEEYQQIPILGVKKCLRKTIK